MTSPTIDLNCDLGERDDAAGVADDLALLEVVTSANIACGGHAGDPHSMERTVIAALERGVALGAHPGYPDRANFGRVACAIDDKKLEDSIASQIDALLQIAARGGGELTHVKPHGALYHAAMTQREVAKLLARSISRVGVDVTLVGLANAPALEVWRGMKFRVAAEAFADRRYEPDGSLRSRTKQDAMVVDASEAAEQAVRIAQGEGARTLSGEIVNIRADTLCLHSDTLNSVANARAVKAALTAAGIGCRQFRNS